MIDSKLLICNNEDIIKISEGCRKSLNIKQRVKIIDSNVVKSPTLLGVIKPKILIPHNVIKQFTEEEMKYIFIHEFIHLKRKDILLNWINTFVLAIHWFNPVVWLIFMRIKKECEISCDEMTLKQINRDEYNRYRETLIKLAGIFSKGSLMINSVAIVNKSEIKRRIIMISQYKKKPLIWTIIAMMVVSLAACSSLTNSKSGNKNNDKNTTSVQKAEDKTKNNESSQNTKDSKVSSQSSSVSSSTSTSVSANTSSSTQDSQGTGMNLTQIQDGNYSSLLGTWTEVAYAVNPQNGTGEQWEASSLNNLSVSSDKIVYGNGVLVIQGNTLKDSAGSHQLSFKNNGDSLDASLTDIYASIYWDISFYQKGAINDIQPNNGVKIDNTKNLIVIWTNNNGCELVFAQTNASNSVANSKTQVQQITYKPYANPRFKYSIEYPDNYVIKLSADNGSGEILDSPDRSAELNLYAGNNVLNDTPQSKLTDFLSKHSNVKYKEQKDNWFVVSWTEDNNIFYQKEVIGSGSYNGYVLKYPASQKDNYDDVITHLNNSFKTPSIDSGH
ncbi:MAG: M56 family metallopeptidase [Bacillota bacterium]|nr:M56 family metallopeptidase [Bacillota bacterium]